MGRTKIITTLQLRREIEGQMRRLLEPQSEDDLARQLEQILEHGDQLLPALLANLETTDPRFRGALGLVASKLPREAIVPTLQATAQDASLSDQARLTAAMILERFLREELDAAALADLENPADVALQTLLEVTSASANDRSILIEYARAFQEQPIEVAQLVLQSMERIPVEEQVETLRVLAQDDRAPVREHALALLGRNRTPEARRALQCLLPTTPRQLRPAIERSLRKLALAGVPSEPLSPPDPSWRTLVSPVDGQGNRSIWFLQPLEVEHWRFLSILSNDRLGIRDSFGGDRVAGQQFPAQQPLGAVHAVPLHETILTLNLLETDFDYGRRLIQTALETNFEKGIPTPVEYRLLNDALWQYRLDEVDASPRLPALSDEEREKLAGQTGQLLDLPDFATWFVQSTLMYDFADQLLKQSSSSSPATYVAVPQSWLADLARAHFEDAEVRAVVDARLREMSEWLYRSGQEHSARLALAASRTLEVQPSSEHPLLLRLVQAGLAVAMGNLSRGLDLRAVYPPDA